MYHVCVCVVLCHHIVCSQIRKCVSLSIDTCWRNWFEKRTKKVYINASHTLLVKSIRLETAVCRSWQTHKECKLRNNNEKKKNYQIKYVYMEITRWKFCMFSFWRQFNMLIRWLFLHILWSFKAFWRAHLFSFFLSSFIARMLYKTW